MSLLTYLPRNRVARLITLILFATLVLLYCELVFVTGPRLTGELLKEQIAKQTRDLYVVDFEKINLSVFSKELKVRNFSLKPAENVPDSIKRVYELAIPELRIRVASIARIYLNRELTLKSISVVDPSIRLIRLNPGGKKSTLSIETGDLYKLISKYLFRFSIGEMDIHNASFEYNDQQKADSIRLFLDEIDFKIENFLIDSIHHNDQLLHTDDINLVITDERFNLPDSVHELSFDIFSFSTRTQNVLFTNLRISEREHPGGDTPNRYNIELPELNFRGVDFNKAYKENELHLDSVRLLEPTISIRHFPHRQSAERRELPDLITQLFDKVTVGQFFLDNAAVSYELLTDSTHSYHFTSQNLSLQIDHFELDSLHLSFKEHLSYFENLKLQSLGFKVVLPDSSHAIGFSKLYLSTKDSVFAIHSLRLTPLQDTITSYGSGVIPSLRLEGIDFSKAWFLGDASARKLTIHQPNLNLRLSSSLREPAGIPFISAFRGLRIEDLVLTDGDFNIDAGSRHFETSRLTFSASHLSLEPNPEGLLLSDTLLVKKLTAEATAIIDGGTGPHVRQMTLDEDGRSIRLTGFSYHKQGESPLNVEEIRVDGFDQNSYRFRGILRFDSMRLTRPVLELKSTPQGNADGPFFEELAQLLSFQKITASGGQVRIRHGGEMLTKVDGITLSINTFHYDSLIHEFFTGIEFRADTFHVAFPGIRHGLSGSHVVLSEEDSLLSIARLEMMPYFHEDTADTYRISTRSLSLKKLDFHELINSGQVHFYDGLLQHPHLQIRLSREQQALAPETLKNRLAFHTFNIVDGNFHLELPPSGIIIDTHDFHAMAIDFDMSDSLHVLFAKNYILEARQSTIVTSQLSDTVKMGHVLANTKSGNFSITDLKVAQENRMNMIIPNLRVKGLEMREYLRHDHIRMDSLILVRPAVNFGWESGSRTSIREQIPRMTIRYVEVSDADLGLYHAEYNQQDSIGLAHVQLQIEQLAYQPKVETATELVKKLHFSGEDFQYRLDDSLYVVKVGKYSYSHPQMAIRLENLALQPTYNRGEFQSKILYQRDWLDATLDELRLDGFQIDSLINHNRLLARKLTFETLTLDTHRDKRLPREAGVYKPLPQSALRSLPLGICIDTVRFSRSYISHSEFSEQGELPGTIFFRDIDLQLLHVSNLQTDSSRRFMNLHGSGTLMNSGNFILDADFDLTHPQDRFTMEGTVGNMDLTEMNRFLEYTAFVEVKEGVNKLVRFNFEANEDYAIGKMIFYYDDLKISMLNQDNYESKGLGVSIKSFFANTFVVNTRNPHFIFVREGDIFYERDQSKSIFNYWGRAILSGVVSSIGAKNNKKEIKKQNDQVRAKYEELSVE